MVLLCFRVVELVTVNKMGVPNIAMIFGPTLMSNENVSTCLVFSGVSNVVPLTFSHLDNLVLSTELTT